MRRLIITGVFACAFAAGVAAMDYRFHWDAQTDIEVRSPCGPFGVKTAHLTFYSVNKAYLLFTCQDDRVILRDVAPFIDDVPSIPSAMVSCPAVNHRACACLPAGSYELTWLNTVGCGQ